MKTEIDVVEELGRLAKVFSRSFEDAEVLVFFAQAICSRITPEQAIKAIRVWAVEKRVFPVPADLIRSVIPEANARDEANEIASDMLGAIARRGYVWPQVCRYDGYENFSDALREELGDSAVGIVEAAGGWPAFCQSFDQVANPNARPQLRDLIESRTKRAAIKEYARLEAPPDEKRLSGMSAAKDAVGEYLAGLKARKDCAENP